jgi:hypothetical protein
VLALSLVLRLALSLVLFLQFPCHRRQNLSTAVCQQLLQWWQSAALHSSRVLYRNLTNLN